MAIPVLQLARIAAQALAVLALFGLLGATAPAGSAAARAQLCTDHGLVEIDWPADDGLPGAVDCDHCVACKLPAGSTSARDPSPAPGRWVRVARSAIAAGTAAGEKAGPALPARGPPAAS